MIVDNDAYGLHMIRLSEVFTTFKSGIQDNSSIRNLHLSLQKLLDKVMLMYAPIRAGIYSRKI